MFFYSETAKDHPQFNEYQQKLTNAVKGYDISSAVISYTPHITAFAYVLTSAVQTTVENDSPYSTLFNILHIGIPILSTCLLGINKVVQRKFASRTEDLIASGLKLGFFQLDPPHITLNETPDDTSLLIDNEQHKIHIDALSHRLLSTS
jgi:2'-5' RNA ligase